MINDKLYESGPYAESELMIELALQLTIELAALLNELVSIELEDTLIDWLPFFEKSIIFNKKEEEKE